MQASGFRWAAGYRGPAGLSPDVVGGAVLELRERLGREATAADLLELASDPKSPLHVAFTWDDAEAAHSHRIAQARQLIGALVVAEVRGGRTITCRAFHSVVSLSGRRGYAPLDEVLASEALRHQAIAEAMRMIDALERKVLTLGALAGDAQPVLEQLRALLRSQPQREPERVD